MDVTLAKGSDPLVEAAVREEWIDRCQAAYPQVYRALLAMGATTDDAADALQDAFEDALRQRGGIASPDGWLFVVANRKLRRTRWRRRLFRPLEHLPAGAGPEPDDRIDLLTELGKLTERQRFVVVARYVVGLTQAEIAELLGVATGTVAATVHQATAHLRGRLLGGTK